MTLGILTTPSVQAQTVPGAPTGLYAVSLSGKLRLNFITPASDGGSPITSYTASCVANTTTVTAGGASSPITVAGLTTGQSYTCTVTAKNSLGTSPPSAGVTKVVRPTNLMPILLLLEPQSPFNHSPATDPGYNSNVLWIPPAFFADPLGNSALVVADRSGASTWPPVTYIPGCINGGNASNYFSGCAAGYDYSGVPAGLNGDYTVTMGPTKTLSIRLKANSTLSTAIKSIKISNADGSSNLGAEVSLWLTTDPTVSYAATDSRCKATASSNLYVYTHATNPTYCPLTANGLYYINIRQNAACTTCRYKLDGSQDDFQ